MKSLNRKIVSILLTLIFVFSPFMTREAEAQWVTWDPGNFIPNWGVFFKDMGMDTMAWQMVNLIIDRMAAQTVNWINSGFEGTPGFVTDTAGFFRDTADGVAGDFIRNNPNLNFLCGPINARIRLTLAQNYIRDDIRWQCTLSEVVDNIDDFMNDFSKGGWDGFFELTQRQQNNPIGAYMQAENALSARISTRQGTLNTELNWGKGIMSWKQCTKRGVPTERVMYNLDGSPSTITEPAPCLEDKIQTPGTVIEDKLNENLGLGSKRLSVADEFNEIVSALMNQLVLQVVGGIGSGLRSLSEPSSSSSSSFTDRLGGSTATSTTDYFENTQDTTIVNQPMPDLDQSPTGRTLVYPPEPSGSGDTGDSGTCDPNLDPACVP